MRLPPSCAFRQSVSFPLVLVGTLLVEDGLRLMMADALEDLGDPRFPFFALIARLISWRK